MVKIDKNIMVFGHRKKGKKVLLYKQANTKSAT
ncbi:hypothetical protein BCD93_003916 [Clostridium saccharoperbutylacetonicum]|nr:hypothetical protein [Clostridium saccharoperbutylacetonicum]